MSAMPGMPCAVCRRESGAVTVNAHGRFAQLCSEKCAHIYLRIGATMGGTEKTAVEATGKAAGEYLETIGKTDLATLTKAEWNAFRHVVFTEISAEMQRVADDEIPF